MLILRNPNKPGRRCVSWHVDLNVSLAKGCSNIRRSLPPSTDSLQHFYCSNRDNKMGSPTGTLLRPPSYHPVIDWMPADGHPQYYVINPMHVVTLRDKSRTFAVRCVEKIKAISEKWFTHILLLIFLIGYACLGAVIFKALEAPLENRERISLSRIRELIIHDMWILHNRNVSLNTWNSEVTHKMIAYEEQVYEAFQNKISIDPEQPQWTFWGAMFYCCTVFTTIGYGNIAPSTKGGRAVTIVYAFIGIPFLLMVLADLGKLFTRAIKLVFKYIRMFYQTGQMKKVRKVGRRATAVPAQLMFAWRGGMPSPSVQSKNSPVNLEGGKENETEEDIVSYAEPLAPSYYEVDDEFNLPVSLAMVILVAYMMLGAFLFTLWENWTFFEAFYFVFISMSTIGFGDYSPAHPRYMMATFIYLLFGLALTSMCINVIQEKLSATFQKAKLRLGNTFGLDMANIIEEDYGKPDITEVHGKDKSKSEKESPPKNDVVANGKTKSKETTENKT
ncbi:TWiK family of potassium channels protein 18-like [Centruroides sculpturatus]|uniref:TWiK family of potassium channels protein 18-like n=1 Tax=Centruroides sculpturatus TaxID=218467 RepID=UPI000C6EE212|nr:TWiK family of potassium channels protein 18-like [Centruroides sculpturatus]